MLRGDRRLTYGELFAALRKAMGYAKCSRIIVNKKLVEKLLMLIERLKKMKEMRLFKMGFEKAAELLQKGEEKEVAVDGPVKEEKNRITGAVRKSNVSSISIREVMTQ